MPILSNIVSSAVSSSVSAYSIQGIGTPIALLSNLYSFHRLENDRTILRIGSNNSLPMVQDFANEQPNSLTLPIESLQGNPNARMLSVIDQYLTAFYIEGGEPQVNNPNIACCFVTDSSEESSNPHLIPTAFLTPFTEADAYSVNYKKEAEFFIIKEGLQDIKKVVERIGKEFSRLEKINVLSSTEYDEETDIHYERLIIEVYTDIDGKEFYQSQKSLFKYLLSNGYENLCANFSLIPG